MKKILILGAAGKIARYAIQQFIERSDSQLTLYLRNAQRLQQLASDRVTVIDGDVTDTPHLQEVAKGHDLVYANLGGDDIVEQAKSVVAALEAADIRRLIWISTLGIYDEVPGAFGEWNHRMLDGGYLEPYSAAASVIEASELDYTIVRPAWLTNKDEVDYELTQKGELFKGTEVSRKSIADFVVKVASDPTQEVRASVGVNKPGTDGDKPSWY
ncbi:SDR family oxidoreductase [Olivibacter sp. XZL3]|uniref:SDR family oxidoreductase n=1 Tax=Olivibacter sp. XZL3 TaxID=1735116 RepID=UPI00106540A9|nr:SDR family oxidoreductase [Olivibacter sp. XZL3]